MPIRLKHFELDRTPVSHIALRNALEVTSNCTIVQLDVTRVAEKKAGSLLAPQDARCAGRSGARWVALRGVCAAA